MLRIAFVIASVISSGCYRERLDPIEPSSASTTRTASPMPSPIRTTIERIGSDYRSNEVKADSTWKGKRVIVTVVPVGIVKNKSGHVMVAAYSGFRKNTDCDFAFVFPIDSKEVESISTGSSVTIEASGEGVMSNGPDFYIMFGNARIVR